MSQTGPGRHSNSTPSLVTSTRDPFSSVMDYHLYMVPSNWQAFSTPPAQTRLANVVRSPRELSSQPILPFAGAPSAQELVGW